MFRVYFSSGIPNKQKSERIELFAFGNLYFLLHARRYLDAKNYHGDTVHTHTYIYTYIYIVVLMR